MYARPIFDPAMLAGQQQQHFHGGQYGGPGPKQRQQQFAMQGQMAYSPVDAYGYGKCWPIPSVSLSASHQGDKLGDRSVKTKSRSWEMLAYRPLITFVGMSSTQYSPVDPRFAQQAPFLMGGMLAEMGNLC